MDIGLDENVHATNSVKLNLLVLVLSPVTHADHVGAAGIVFLVTFSQNGVGVQGLTQAATLVRFDPRVVIDCNESAK